MIEHLLTPLICPRFLTDERYRRGHLSILSLPAGVKVLGVHNPEMQSLARSLAHGDDARKLLNDFPLQTDLCYEEQMVWGLMTCYLSCTTEQHIALLRSFVPHIDNWAVCDSVCSKCKWIARKTTDQHMVRAFIDSLFASDKEFEVRFAIVLCLSYYINDEALPEIFSRFDSLFAANMHQHYYVRMAIAWFLATSLYKSPVLTRRYASSPSLPLEVKKLYIRKARESFRTRTMNPLN